MVLQIERFKADGAQANHPSVSVAVAKDFKLLGGGAVIGPGDGAGNMLTASYPLSIFEWFVAAKDQNTADPRSITAYAYGLSDPQDQYDVQIFSAVSGVDPMSHPTATVTVPSRYTLVGGGAQAHYSVQGQFLVTSGPTPDGTGWIAQSQDHVHVEAGTVTAYAVGLRARNGTPVDVAITSDSSISPSSTPEVDVPVRSGYTLIGGGAMVIGTANLLTVSGPDLAERPDEWMAASRDQQTSSPARITAWAIGLR